MSETNAPEPTMEEILASIRRIISEDDAPAPAAAEETPAHAEPHAAPIPAPEAHPHPHDDVLELTERVEPSPAFAAPSAEPPPSPPAASLGDLDFGVAPSFAPQPPPSPEPAPRAPAASRAAGDEPLVGQGTAGRVADHFGALHSRVTMPSAERTLEDVVRELLRPMLKDWLDQHLPAIVEARVQDEVERISRRRTY
jgi:cell pole-organizing protein PopZ